MLSFSLRKPASPLGEGKQGTSADAYPADTGGAIITVQAELCPLCVDLAAEMALHYRRRQEEVSAAMEIRVPGPRISLSLSLSLSLS